MVKFNKVKEFVSLLNTQYSTAIPRDQAIDFCLTYRKDSCCNCVIHSAVDMWLNSFKTNPIDIMTM